MSRTITVKGVGRVSTPPDYIVISMSLEAQDTNYEKAMEQAALQIDYLNKALESVGFKKKSVKTVNFNVRTDYERVKDRNGNYKSVFNMTRHVGAVMMKQRSGRIINVSSVAGLYGNPGQFNYSASKAGIVGMTLTTAKELGPRGITANAIAPGFIETPMTDVLDEKVKARCMEAVALRRFGKPEEVASVVSFLASDDASYVSGQVIVIDGAMQM